MLAVMPAMRSKCEINKLYIYVCIGVHVSVVYNRCVFSTDLWPVIGHFIPSFVTPVHEDCHATWLDKFATSQTNVAFRGNLPQKY